MVLLVRLVAVIMERTYAGQIGVRQRLLGENLALPAWSIFGSD
ncbi:hypothetical protein [Bradyrhizobium sp. BR 1433]